PHDPSAAHTASFSLVLLGSSGHFRLHPTSSGYLQYLVSHNSEFCNGKCRQSFYTAKNRAERIASRQGRKCLWCSGPIPAEARGDVIYCSQTCSNRSQNDMIKTRRICRQCGMSFCGNGPFCCHACYSDSRREKHHRPCPVCGIVFKPHRHEQVTCSKACMGKRMVTRRAKSES
ncbi:MAG: hypothetical protein ACK5LJ_02375, partial [Paracoccus sp. (in: a-proteobacteria)]